MADKRVNTIDIDPDMYKVLLMMQGTRKAQTKARLNLREIKVKKRRDKKPDCQRP
jgi:hypothetical protein